MKNVILESGYPWHGSIAMDLQRLLWLLQGDTDDKDVYEWLRRELHYGMYHIPYHKLFQKSIANLFKKLKAKFGDKVSGVPAAPDPMRTSPAICYELCHYWANAHGVASVCVNFAGGENPGSANYNLPSSDKWILFTPNEDGTVKVESGPGINGAKDSAIPVPMAIGADLPLLNTTPKEKK